ncbi:MAG: helix-turn-helix transcriptional regulator [Pyrinomonadaceae bacterium]
MKNTNKGPFKNQLALIRQRNHIQPNQIAKLLGHKTTNRVTEYESGIKTPNLKTALKLAHIYDLPIRVMLDGYYAAVRDEIKREELRLIAKTRGKSRVVARSTPVEYCSIEAKADSASAGTREASHARRHATDLIRKSAEKLGHI